MARILSVGAALPEQVVTSEALDAHLGQAPGWTEERTGIRTRRRAADGEMAYHLGTAAARQALLRAGRGPDDLDAIIFSTMFVDYANPGGGALIQRDLGGKRPVPAFDLRDQCAGFLYGLSLADTLIRAGRSRLVLVVAAERQHESFLAYPPTAPVFGDAGAAVLMGPAEAPDQGILALELGADGRGAEMALVTCATTDPFRPENRTPELQRALAEAAERPPSGSKIFYWSGFELYRTAVTTMAQVTEAVVARVGATLRDVDWFLFHQANWHINQAVVRRLGVDPARCPGNIDRYGNTTSASIPLLLDDLLADGRLRPGQLVVLCTFGAGYAWGAAAVRW